VSNVEIYHLIAELKEYSKLSIGDAKTFSFSKLLSVIGSVAEVIDQLNNKIEDLEDEVKKLRDKYD
jgi:hypothetical protein